MSAPLVTDTDYQRLVAIIETFQHFGVGKDGLIKLRDYDYKPDDYNYPLEYEAQIRRVVEENRKLRDDYNSLLHMMQHKAREHLHEPIANVKIRVPA
jgi:hypothetical protein